MTPNAHLDVDVDCDEDILEARLDEVLESSEYWNLCAAVLSEASSRLDTEHTVSEEPPAAIVEGAGIEHILILRELGKIMAATGDAISRLRALGMMPLDFAAPRNNDPLWFLVDRSISATIVRSLLGNARASVCLFALGAARRHPVSAHVRACLVSWLFGGAQHYLAYLAAIHPTTAEFVRFVPASMRINLDEIVALHKRAALGYEYALRVANETHSSVWAVSEREGTDTESSDGD